MHIHLPKLVHNWREFLSEIGIIVVGILIALGLEQVIELAHWRHKADQAIENLHGAFAITAWQAEEQRITGPCVDRQLEMLAARVAAPGPYRPTPLFSERGFPAYTVRAPARPWGDTVWQAATGGGVSTHLPSELRAKIDIIYSSIDEMRNRTQQAQVILSRLNALARPITLDAPSRLRLLQDIEEVRGQQALMTLYATELVQGIKDAGMLPPRASMRPDARESGTVAFCLSHRLPMGAAR